MAAEQCEHFIAVDENETQSNSQALFFKALSKLQGRGFFSFY